jgi:hypothetical protein
LANEREDVLVNAGVNEGVLMSLNASVEGLALRCRQPAAQVSMTAASTEFDSMITLPARATGEALRQCRQVHGNTIAARPPIRQ